MSNMSKKGIKTGVLIYIITYLGGAQPGTQFVASGSLPRYQLCRCGYWFTGVFWYLEGL